jgi:hypothetical protein
MIRFALSPSTPSKDGQPTRRRTFARAVIERARVEGETLPRKVRAFCERHTAEDVAADLVTA